MLVILFLFIILIFLLILHNFPAYFLIWMPSKSKSVHLLPFLSSFLAFSSISFMHFTISRLLFVHNRSFLCDYAQNQDDICVISIKLQVHLLSFSTTESRYGESFQFHVLLNGELHSASNDSSPRQTSLHTQCAPSIHRTRYNLLCWQFSCSRLQECF